MTTTGRSTLLSRRRGLALHGRRVYYGLDDAHVGVLYRVALDHVNHRSVEGVS
ncbi:MAG: hypothetical protein M3R02_18025 [Chloroflexota bacterium]|nr:hypothetical protein [Chloroflexota bacterium]